jgi:hypothetical protein
MMIVIDNSRVVNKLETPLTDDARVVNYDRHMFIVPATGFNVKKLFSMSSMTHHNKLVRLSLDGLIRGLLLKGEAPYS